LLTTGTGLPVLGDGGPIALPPFETIEIGDDGTSAFARWARKRRDGEVGPHPAGEPAAAEMQRGRTG
jgi:flagellar basal-body rod protein FlgF